MGHSSTPSIPSDSRSALSISDPLYLLNLDYCRKMTANRQTYIHSHLGRLGKGAQKKKSKKKLISVSFMYVCVVENAELLVFFTFFFATSPQEIFFQKGCFEPPHSPTTLPHPSPNCHQSQKPEFCSYFCPKKCPSFACTFTKMSLSEGFGTLPFQTFL